MKIMVLVVFKMVYSIYVVEWTVFYILIYKVTTVVLTYDIVLVFTVIDTDLFRHILNMCFCTVIDLFDLFIYINFLVLYLNID